MKTNPGSIVLLLVSVLFAQGWTSAPEKHYVCLPCGQACDGTIHAAAGVCPMCNMRLVDAAGVTFKNIDFAELCKRLKANKQIVLLDVRSKEEFNNTITDKDPYGRFKNAVNININELESRIGELNKFKGREVIVYCSHSHRSPQASYILNTHGFTNVKNVSGGVSVLSPGDAQTCFGDQYISFPAK